MHSIRPKITLMTVSAVLIVLSIATLIGVISIRDLGKKDADQMLHLICETGANNLETYFESVEQSVETVATLVQDSLEGMPYEDLDREVERARRLFDKVAFFTNGVLTYYLRIDPEVSDDVEGFWYVNLDGRGFREHQVTDIRAYDTNDTSSLVWFTIPKATGENVWLPPYYTDSLNVLVVSYNVPIYWEDRFLGVIGIEIDYHTLAREVENIHIYQEGYAFILDEDSNIIYHPKEDSQTQAGENLAVASPKQVIGDNHIEYVYEKVVKEAVWQPLSNGMRLYVTVPRAEIDAGWLSLIGRILIVSAVLLILISLFTMRYTGLLTKPLTELTRAAREVDSGNYEVRLDYDKDDEVGSLTHTFRTLIAHTKEHISTLNRQAYIDALTGVKNKRAYGDKIQELQDEIDRGESLPVFAVGVFDCDNLKYINDSYGHDRGDIYLKTACRLICRVFTHSPVYRIGGDEFAVILQQEDYDRREELIENFRLSREEICRSAQNEWERVGITLGLAVYEPEFDPYVIDVARRADKCMYENKKSRRGEGRC